MNFDYGKPHKVGSSTCQVFRFVGTNHVVLRALHHMTVGFSLDEVAVRFFGSMEELTY